MITIEQIETWLKIARNPPLKRWDYAEGSFGYGPVDVEPDLPAIYESEEDSDYSDKILAWIDYQELDDRERNSIGEHIATFNPVIMIEILEELLKYKKGLKV